MDNITVYTSSFSLNHIKYRKRDRQGPWEKRADWGPVAVERSHFHASFAVQHRRRQAGHLARRRDPCSRVGYTSYCIVDSK